MKRADLPGLAIFVVVASRRSFRAAARELGISVSAVSHAINGLETSLGVRILSRTTRSVAVTDAGQRLLDQLEPALKAIEEAVEAATASQNRLTGNIRLSVAAFGRGIGSGADRYRVRPAASRGHDRGDRGGCPHRYRRIGFRRGRPLRRKPSNRI